MKVYFSRYNLTPIKRANRLSSLDKKSGVIIKGVLGNKVTFADYFPHLPLGDRSVDEFLDTFKFQNEEYDQKVFDLLLKDYEFQNIKAKKILCHQLWTGSEEILSDTVKYKLQHGLDRTFIYLLEKNIRVRLDANALFDRQKYKEFTSSIPEKYHSLIEYLEDPLHDHNWEGLHFKRAQDFIPGTPIDYYIYKPNCEFKPKLDVPIIYSGYLGSPLGNWHAYCDLISTGDLKLKHGMFAYGFYEEDRVILEGSYREGFMPSPRIVKKIYQDASDLEWKKLCSM